MNTYRLESFLLERLMLAIIVVTSCLSIYRFRESTVEVSINIIFLLLVFVVILTKYVIKPKSVNTDCVFADGEYFKLFSRDQKRWIAIAVSNINKVVVLCTRNENSLVFYMATGITESHSVRISKNRIVGLANFLRYNGINEVEIKKDQSFMESLNGPYIDRE